MRYLVTTGCPSGAAAAAPVPAGTDDRRCRSWRQVPTEFPPDTTVQRFSYGWRDDGTWRRINHYDAGTTIQGRKRHILTATDGLTDPDGLLVAATVPAADIPDRDGAVPLPASLRKVFPRRWRRRAIDPRRGPDRRRWRRWWRHVCAAGG